MNALWTAALALLIFVVVSRLRRRTRHARAQRTAPPSRTISGWQINAYLDPRMPSACLYDHGLQYGMGFRRKEGPTLPHGAGCRCEAVPFSFSSTQVFGGALRNVAQTRGVIPGLTLPQVRTLIEALKQQEARSLPARQEDYAAAVDLSLFPTAQQQAIAAFLVERYAHLKQMQQDSQQATPAPGAPQGGGAAAPDAGAPDAPEPEAMDGK